MQQKLTGRLFDVIMIDPPWQLSSSDPTRGVGSFPLLASLSRLGRYSIPATSR